MPVLAACLTLFVPEVTVREPVARLLAAAAYDSGGGRVFPIPFRSLRSRRRPLPGSCLSLLVPLLVPFSSVLQMLVFRLPYL